jgi:tRNA-2-methylthio-N6-dimethylallyladenosine synthase
MDKVKTNTKKVFIRTFGCQMNERDSEWVIGCLLDKGFHKAESQDSADIVIFNTCSVRKHAEERAISIMGQLQRLKKKRPGLILGLMGCTAEYYGEKLLERLPHVDFVCGTGKMHKIPEIIKNVIDKKAQQTYTGSLEEHPPESNPDYRTKEKSAYVSISRGCDNYCTYCIVPYVRGPERSRKPEDIVSEVRDLIGRGYGDIMLLGQNVNSYGKDLNNGVDFVKLLEMIDGVEGEKSVKFMTSHPKDASIKLFEAIRDLKGVAKELHLPLQSGSDRVLKAMNRGYDSEYYSNLIKKFKRILPGSALTTDIIVGFPGETEDDYGDTKRMLEEIEFGASYIFKYSPRSPALSSEMEDDVPKDVKERRHRELLDTQKSISRKKKGLM